jgi:hypothetical protein
MHWHAVRAHKQPGRTGEVVKEHPRQYE